MRAFFRSFKESYVREHPLAYCWAVGSAIAGAVYLYQVITGTVLSPVLTEQPDGVQIIWALFYLVGGVLAGRGIRLCMPRLEAPGFILLGAATAIAVTINVFAGPAGPNYVTLGPGGGLALGAILRAYLLVRNTLIFQEVRKR